MDAARLERLQKRRAELTDAAERLQANLSATKGALVILDEEIAIELAPPSSPSESNDAQS